jgi:hypothetical protein
MRDNARAPSRNGGGSGEQHPGAQPRHAVRLRDAASARKPDRADFGRRAKGFNCHYNFARRSGILCLRPEGRAPRRKQRQRDRSLMPPTSKDAGRIGSRTRK